jgi:hypothetical protein
MKSKVIDAFCRVQKIDFRQICFKLANDKDSEQWTDKDIETGQLLYTCYLALLLAYRDKPIVLAPPVLADKFWHQHILDTRKYMKDCDEIFGEYLHHFPYFGMRGEQDAQELKVSGNFTRKLMMEHFAQLPECKLIFDDVQLGECSNCGGSCSSCSSCKGAFQWALDSTDNRGAAFQ